MKHKILYIILVLPIYFAQAQSDYKESSDSLVLDLQAVVDMANSSSLSAFRAKNMYLASYWEYRAFKANRLPSLSLNLVPARYHRDFTRRYDFEQNVDIYREQQSFYAYGNLALQQNFDLLGGTFFVDSELGYLRNFGDKAYSQYNSVPIRIGYRQQLLGYNRFKWEKKIEPLKFEKAKKELIYNLEQTAEEATTYFFDLAMAQAKHKLAKENLNSADTLYRIGQEKHKIAGIKQTELLTLKLDMINAKNSLKNAEISEKRAMFALASYLKMEKDAKLRLILPDYPDKVNVSVSNAIEYAKQNNPKFLKSRQNLLELEQNLDKTKKESMFNLGISASVGFNQVAKTFEAVYQSPQQQDVASLTLLIPILDWGVRKGRYNMALNNLHVAELTSQQEELKIEEDVIITVGDFEVQQNMIAGAEEALNLAKLTHEQTKQRFIIGDVDINSITLSNNRYQEAQHNYILALKNYWLSYFKIRRLTLYDFEKNAPITVEFDTVLRSSVFGLPSSVFRLRSSVFGLPSSVFRLRSSVSRLPSFNIKLYKDITKLESADITVCLSVI